MSIKNFLRLLCITMVLATSIVHADISDPEDEVFARVGVSVIMVNEYKQALISSSRNTFYHGTPPESELLVFQQDVADQIINRELLLQQAKQLGLEIEQARIEKELDIYRQRARRRGQTVDEESDDWQVLRLRIQRDLLIEDVENNIRQGITLPSEVDLQSHYETHPEKFTEPARFDLSTILLGVNPAAGAESWEAARQEAQELVNRLREGADFGELARIHSSDESAAAGGELGYSHAGMFSAPAQEVIEKLASGEISAPIQVLEGIVIFRLNDRMPARLMEFSQVRERVKELWLRDERDHQWQDYLEKLRKNTSIEITEKYLTLSGKESDVPDNADEN